MRGALVGVWLLLLVVGLVVMTRGLSATTYFEPTSAALAQARRGRDLILVASAVLLVAAVGGFVVLGVPWWACLLLLVPAALCPYVALATPWIPLVAVVVLYPCVGSAALIGVVSQP